MVFPGRFSAGCLLCRTRKVKCDETSPACRRCATYGKVCPGYPDAYAFRSENEKLRYKLNRRLPAAFTAPNSVAQGLSAYDFNSRAIEFNRAALKPAPEELSLCYFMTAFIYPCPENVFQGHLDFLPELYCDGRRNCQDLAIMSVAYLAAFNKWRSWDLFKEARKYYGAAIISLQNALQSSTSAQCDNTFAAALVLALFVDISNERNMTANPHMYGIYQLLMLRGPEQLSTSLGRTLSGYALTQLCIEFMLNKDLVYQGLDRLLPWFSGHDLLDRSRCLVIRQINLCCRLRDIHTLLDNNKDTELLSQKTSRRITVICEAVEHSLLNLREVDEFNRDAEYYWDAQKRARSEISTLNNALGGEGYKDEATALSIALIRSSQLEFCSELMHCCEKLNNLSTVGFLKGSKASLFPLEIGQLEERIVQSAAKVVSLMQYVLGTSKNDNDKYLSSPQSGFAGLAHIIIWAAYAVARCPLSTPDQISYGQQVLSELGSSMGIYTAYRLLEMPLCNRNMTTPHE